MTLAEALNIIQEKRDKKPTLSVQLAAKVRVAVGVNLDDSVTLRELYQAGHKCPDPSASLDWKQFLAGLNFGEYIAITNSLRGLAFMVSDETAGYITVGDIRRANDIKAFAKNRGLYKSVFGLSFFKLAFEKEIVDL